MAKNNHLGTDVALKNGEISAAFGDADIVEGRNCYIQDLCLRLTTPKGSLWCHPNYGIDIYRFLHLEGTYINRLDLAQAIQEETENDPRTESAQVSINSWDGTKVKLTLTAKPIDESSPVNLVLGYDLATMTMEVVTGG
ncbi:MAG: hypothetical protein ACM3YE_14520 [Bacteroidota bacterium]